MGSFFKGYLIYLVDFAGKNRKAGRKLAPNLLPKRNLKMVEAMADSHKLFLQSFMSKGILDGKSVRHLHKMAVERYPGNEQDLVSFVNVINGNISGFHLEIKKGRCEETGTSYYGLVNTAETEISKLSTDYSVSELDYFKKLVEAIVSSDEGIISSMEALNLTEHLDKNVKKVGKKEAENLLERMAREKWIVQGDRGELSLSTRCLMELDQYIQEQFQETVTKCSVCNRLCLKGQSCSTCDVKLHLYCASHYFKNQEDPKCPGVQGSDCGAPWPHTVPIMARKDGISASQSTSTQSTDLMSTQESEPTITRKRKSRP